MMNIINTKHLKMNFNVLKIAIMYGELLMEKMFVKIMIAYIMIM